MRLDPNLSVTVLRTVNSAYYGFTGTVDSISRAVNMIGIGELHTMVLGISAVSALDFPNDILPLKAFWRSSLFTGVLSRLLAEQAGIRRCERLFILGLLHEIGHLVLYAKFPEQAKASIKLAQMNQLPIHQMEQKILGYHYGEIGAMLMGQWQLSESYQTSTRFQPTPQQATEEQVETALVHISHGYAHFKFKDSSQPVETLIDPAAWEISQLDPEAVENLFTTAQTVSADMERIILK